MPFLDLLLSFHCCSLIFYCWSTAFRCEGSLAEAAGGDEGCSEGAGDAAAVDAGASPEPQNNISAWCIMSWCVLTWSSG